MQGLACAIRSAESVRARRGPAHAHRPRLTWHRGLCACGCAAPCRLFKSFEEDEERTRRLAAALEHESTATSLHFALFPRKTRDGGLQPSCREPVVSMMVCLLRAACSRRPDAPAPSLLARIARRHPRLSAMSAAGICGGSVFPPRRVDRPARVERVLSRERLCRE